MFETMDQLSLIQQYYTYDNFCDTKIKYIMYKVQDSSILYYNMLLAQLYIRVTFTNMWKNTYITASFQYKGKFEPIKLVYPCHYLLKCLYQTRKVSGHVYVLGISILFLFLRFFDLILELFRLCGILCFFILLNIFLEYHTKKQLNFPIVYFPILNIFKHT